MDKLTDVDEWLANIIFTAKSYELMKNIHNILIDCTELRFITDEEFDN